MEVGAERLIFFADLRQLGGDCIQLGGDGYSARDCGAEDREDGAFAGCASGKWRRVVQGGPERSWSTKGGCGPRGPSGPLRSALIHTFGNFTQNVDQGGSGWTRRTRGTITPLRGPGVVFTFC